jgi:hypothetical protein
VQGKTLKIIRISFCDKAIAGAFAAAKSG